MGSCLWLDIGLLENSRICQLADYQLADWTTRGLDISRTGQLADLYKPCTGHTGCTGQCMNHAPAILAAPALIYSMHRLLVVWILVVHFHLCSLLDRCTALEVWAVWRPMRVCCGSQWGRCVLFTNILDSLTAPCLVYNTAMYTVYGRCGGSV